MWSYHSLQSNRDPSSFINKSQKPRVSSTGVRGADVQVRQRSIIGIVPNPLHHTPRIVRDASLCLKLEGGHRTISEAGKTSLKSPTDGEFDKSAFGWTEVFVLLIDGEDCRSE